MWDERNKPADEQQRQILEQEMRDYSDKIISEIVNSEVQAVANQQGISLPGQGSSASASEATASAPSQPVQTMPPATGSAAAAPPQPDDTHGQQPQVSAAEDQPEAKRRRLSVKQPME